MNSNNNSGHHWLLLFFIAIVMTLTGLTDTFAKPMLPQIKAMQEPVKILKEDFRNLKKIETDEKLFLDANLASIIEDGNKSKNKSSGMFWLKTGSGILLFMAVGFLGYLFWKKNKFHIHQTSPSDANQIEIIPELLDNR
jgi:hypothetical protein